MSSISKVLVLAVLTLISTTIDDFVVLLTFCSENEASKISRAEKNSNYWKIAGGYMAGFTIVVLISLLGLVLSYLVEPEYIALLGFIPILIGLKMLYEAYQDNAFQEFYDYAWHCKKPEDEEEKPKETVGDANGENALPQQTIHRVHSAHIPKHPSITEHSPHSTATIETTSPLQTKLLTSADMEMAAVTREEGKEDGDKVEEVVGDEEMNYFAKKFEEALFACGLNRQFVIVAATTFSVGSDNIAVYVSLFSQTDGADIALIIAVFYFMTIMYAVVCIFVIGNVKGLGETLDILAKPFVPFVLMGIGAYILNDSILADAMK